MHIAFVVTRSDQMSGPQVHLRDIAHSLTSEGHRASILSGGDGAFGDELSRLGLEHQRVSNLVAPIRPLDDLRALFQIRKALAAIRPDLVSTHSSKAGILGRMAATSLGIPALHTAHGWAFHRACSRSRSRIYSLAERFAARRSAGLIAVSNHDRCQAIRRGICPPSQIQAIPNGVREIRASELADPFGTPVRFTMVARLERQKDHPTLLAALRHLAAKPWALDLVGDGACRQDLERLASRYGLGDRVRFLGARNDVAELLSKSQVFVLSSRYEGLPRSILEAMRAGLPVVASRVGGVPEAIVDGQTGFLVEPEKVTNLASRLDQLLRQPNLRQAMGSAGRDRFLELFTFDRMYRRTRLVYDSTLRLRHDEPESVLRGSD